MKKLFTTLALSILISQGAMAKDELKLGIRVGDTFPEFTLTNQEGKTVTNKDTLSEKGAVYLFVRSVDWCPYCKGQVESWSKRADKFVNAGYKVTTFAYDDTAKAKKFHDEFKITFDVLRDANSKIIKKIGILNEDFAEGHRFHGIPHPHIYLLDNTGVIQEKFTENSFRSRPNIDEVLGSLK